MLGAVSDRSAEEQATRNVAAHGLLENRLLFCEEAVWTVSREKGAGHRNRGRAMAQDKSFGLEAAFLRTARRSCVQTAPLNKKFEQKLRTDSRVRIRWEFLIEDWFSRLSVSWCRRFCQRTICYFVDVSVLWLRNLFGLRRFATKHVLLSFRCFLSLW